MKNSTNPITRDLCSFCFKNALISVCLFTGMTTVAWSQTDYITPGQTNSAISVANRPSTVVFSQHPANTKICTGGSGSFNVVATGSSSLIYQWQESIDAGNTWNDIVNGGVYTGATGAVLTITGPASSMDTYRYRCLVSDGSSSASDPAMLTVGPNISLIDQVVTNCPATASNLTTPPATGVVYQWQVSTDNAANWVNAVNGADVTGVIYSGVTTGNLQISNLSPSIDGHMYRYLADDGAGCAVISGIITQRVPALAGFTQPNTIPAGFGDTATISVNVSSGSGPFTFRWTVSTNGGITYSNLSNNATYSGATTDSLTINTITAAMFNYRYRLVVRNSNLCATANSSYSQLMLNIPLAVKLRSFTAQKLSHSSAKLQWEIDDEHSIGTFVIQKSVEGTVFNDIGVVNTSLGITSYNFTDTKLGNGATRYRLKITDQQGTIVLSKITQVTNRDIPGDLVLKPSIVTGNFSTLYIRVNQKANITFTILDLNGLMRWSQSAMLEKGEHNIPLNLERFNKGLYYVQVTEDYRRIKVLPLLKQ